MADIKKIEEFAIRCYDNLKRGSRKWHDHGEDVWEDHISLVREFAVQLAEIEGADKEVVEISAILHDIGKIDGRENHGELGAQMTEEFLKDIDLPDEKKRLIVKCVRKHRSRFAQEDNEIEVKVLQSADGLSSLFEDKWQEMTKKHMSKDDYFKLLDRTFNHKINLESAKKIAKPKFEQLKRNY